MRLCTTTQNTHTESLQSCPTLCDPGDCNLPSSSVHGILQARTWEWVAVPPPGDLSEPGMEPIPPAPPALTGGFFTTSATWEAQNLQGAAEAVLRRKFQVIQVKVKVKVTQSCPTLRPHGLYSPWNSPGQNSGVGSRSLLQGIFPNSLEPKSSNVFAPGSF